MKFPDSFYSALQEDTLLKVKGGAQRERFLEIWMVAVGDRVFARSWSKSKRSWFTAFLEEGIGAVAYRNKEIQVKGEKVAPNDPIQADINKAYLLKYTQEQNKYYAEGITQDEYLDYTLEFIL